jgi:predicted secreted protein
MNESCDVIVVVKAGGEFFSARKKVKVVVGGCG